MATRTYQVKHFYNVAKSIGLKRGDFSAKCPIDKNGEYESMQVTIYARTTEQQVRELAKHYNVTVCKMGDVIKWHMLSINYSGKEGLTILDLDEKDEYGLYKVTRLI